MTHSITRLTLRQQQKCLVKYCLSQLQQFQMLHLSQENYTYFEWNVNILESRKTITKKLPFWSQLQLFQMKFEFCLICWKYVHVKHYINFQVYVLKHTNRISQQIPTHACRCLDMQNVWVIILYPISKS